MAIGTAYIKIMPEAKGISGQISGMVDPAAESAGKSGGGKWVSAFKKVLVGAAVGKWIGDSVLAGADLEQSIGGIETLYKSASGKMMQYASQAYKTAGIDANTYMQQATSFSAALIKSYNGDVSKAASATDQAIIDMADNANKMGTPLENIQNAYQGFAKQNYTMLDNLKLGYGGTKTEMERLLKDAQKITGVEYNIDNLGDVYEAIHVIQTELDITGTTSKEAASTISGSIGMVKAAYKDLVGNLALGNDVYPQIKNLVSSTITMLGNVVPAIGRVIIGIPKAIIEHFPEIKTALTTAANNALLAFKQNFPMWRAAVVELITNAGQTIITNIPTFIASVGTLIKKAISLIKTYLPSIMLAVSQILANLLKTLVTNIPSILKAAFNLAKTLVKSGLSLVKTILKAFVNSAKLIVTNLFGNIISKIKTKFAEIKTNIGTKLGEIKTKIVTSVATFASNLLKPFKEAKTNIASKFNEIKSSIAEKIGDIKAKIDEKVENIKEKLTKPFTSARDTIKKIIDKIKGFFPLSMGKLFGDIKLPHFSVSGKFPYGIGGKGEKPSFSIEWYKKAESDPYMFQGATLFGAGERNDEILYGRKNLLEDIASVAGGDEITINVYGGNMNAEEIADAVERKLIQRQKRKQLAWQ